MDEDVQQRITYLLQEIDANICAAHRSATQICGTVRRHHQILRQIHEASRVWRPLFDSFTQQPAARRATRTPSRFSRPFTPGSTRAATATQRQQQDLEREDDEDLEDDTSFMSREETFKTTTLKKHQPPSSDHRNTSADSLDVSTNSDNLPRMSRTPYMSKSAVQSGAMTQESTSTLSSTGRGRWSPRMTSPPRTGIISGDQPETAHAGPRQISTPPSAISSVEYSSNSPGISRNLMKIGAFEYTPPRDKKSRSGGKEKEADETNDSIETPYVPEFSTVRLSTAMEKGLVTTADDVSSSTRTSESASNRKRKRSDAADNRRTPVYPKTIYPAKATSPFKSPSLRRKYSSRSNAASPSHRGTPAATTPPRQRNEVVIDDDTPRTPDFDLASPLLRTQLKAMTPNTPLSNRLVGASLDVGSVSQEARLLDYDDSFTAGEPTPKFELSLLPAVFQRGVGAVQVSTLYSKFQGADNDKPAISVDQLAEMLPDYGKEKIEILLDTLVSRRLLRPFVVEGTMFWQKPL
ncbi:hypothetical protein PPTG_19852 [Phytophthora nicotianae INRA-310]|uniref:Uncharacterized protein n=1 Tax=Phytophthora nicotianae (strain INRA-310) TaxID=761204 RepID=W2PCS0_PHYN3|nr:hypothetical protein PPTG_19852 [Phytophthora nicotianae INRA-310]ETM98023.1 hypothetical protein PPTG_19852 [Phytophthora nicotianae INRA-310]